MRRTVVAICLMSLMVGTTACRRTTEQKKDRHLEAGYALLLSAPDRALIEFERSKDQRGAKEYAVGQAHEALGNLDEAKAHYERAIVQRPGFIKAETARARIDLVRGHTAAALERLAGTVAKDPSDLTSLLLYAVAATTADDRKKALTALGAWPKRTKQKPPAEYFLARASLERDEAAHSSLSALADSAREAPVHSVPAALVLAKLAATGQKRWLAEVLLTRVLAEKLTSAEATHLAALALGLGDQRLARNAAQSIQPFPELAQSQLVLGQLELSGGDPALAAKYLKKSLQLLPPGPSPERDQSEFFLAQALLRQKDIEHAAPLVEALAGRDPKNLSVQLLLADLDVDRGATRVAVERLERLRAAHPGQPLILEHLAKARLAAGDADGALQAERERLLLSPDDPRPLAALIETLIALGRKDEALKELQARADSRPDDETLWLLLARTCEELDRPLELRTTLTRFTGRHPESESAWLSLARLEEREHHADAVRRALEAALAANPKSAQTLEHLAEWWMRQEKWQDAASAYEKLLAIAPANTSALNNLGYLYADRLGEPEKAVAAAERAHELAGSRPVIEDTLGWALLRRGKAEDRKRALDLLKHAREFLHQEDVRLHLAVALHLSGDQEQAQELLVGFRFRPADPGHDFARSVLTKG